jgi:hypothetical protein
LASTGSRTAAASPTTRLSLPPLPLHLPRGPLYDRRLRGRDALGYPLQRKRCEEINTGNWFRVILIQFRVWLSLDRPFSCQQLLYLMIPTLRPLLAKIGDVRTSPPSCGWHVLRERRKRDARFAMPLPPASRSGKRRRPLRRGAGTPDPHAPQPRAFPGSGRGDRRDACLRLGIQRNLP